MEIPIKYKKDDYYYNYGNNRLGFYSRGILTIEENNFSIKPTKRSVLRWFLNNYPIAFDDKEPVQFYKNQFGMYKIKYSTNQSETEIALKIDRCFHHVVDEFILKRNSLNLSTETNQDVS